MYTYISYEDRLVEKSWQINDDRAQMRAVSQTFVAYSCLCFFEADAWMSYAQSLESWVKLVDDFFCR